METKSSKRNRLTLYIGIALLAGIILGFILNKKYVGEHNLKIANAEAQASHLLQKMKQYEQPKDTAAAATILSLRKTILEQKKLAEQSLLNTDNESLALTNIKLWSDSLKNVNLQLAALTDTMSVEYKDLVKQKDLVSLQKNDIIKQRDKKLDWFTILADIFLRLIKMIVAPLVFTTLVVGVAKLGDIKSVGRIGGKTLLWFISASLLSLLLGMILVNIFEPGKAMQLTLPDSNVNTGIDKAALTIKDFFYHVFPASVVDAMAKNEILQIVVFALFFLFQYGFT